MLLLMVLRNNWCVRVQIRTQVKHRRVSKKWRQEPHITPTNYCKSCVTPTKDKKLCVGRNPTRTRQAAASVRLTYRERREVSSYTRIIKIDEQNTEIVLTILAVVDGVANNGVLNRWLWDVESTQLSSNLVIRRVSNIRVLEVQYGNTGMKRSSGFM